MATLASYATKMVFDKYFWGSTSNTARLSYVPDAYVKNIFWDTTLPSAIPHTCPMEALTFIVLVTFQPGISFKKTLLINPTNLAPGLKYSSELLSWHHEDENVPLSNVTSAQFTVTIQPTSSKAPWSINQTLFWQVTIDSVPMPVNGGGMIEVYGIRRQPQYFQTEGIPIDLLRLFVPTSLAATVTNELTWIQWVAGVCHGTQDPKATPGQLRTDSTPHWLRYNVWDGQKSFIGETGREFNLMGWLKAYTDHVANPASNHVLVNCFDQAAIVETALGLGVDFARLHWEDMAPFGYIDADLIGWGSTNSPFFEADYQNIRFSDTNLADPMRTPFRDHVFITVAPEGKSPYEKTKSTVVDACAGPVRGVPYNDYINAAGRHSGIKFLEEGHGLPAQDGKGGIGYAGVTSTTPTSPEDPWTFDGRVKYWMPGTRVSLEEQLRLIQSNFVDTPLLLPGFSAQKAIRGILDPIVGSSVPGLPIDKSSASTPLVDDTNVVAGAATTQHNVAIHMTGTDGGPAFISLKVSVFTGGASAAVAASRVRLGRFSALTAWKADGTINVKGPPDNEFYAIHDKNAIVFGTQHVDIFVYKNVLVEVAANDGKLSGFRPGWTKALWKALAEH